MERIKVESSNIESVGWENDTLEVAFKNNRTYHYHDLTKEVYEMFLKAESKGKFLNQFVKERYVCERVA
jgi:hypothetical protein